MFEQPDLAALRRLLVETPWAILESAHFALTAVLEAVDDEFVAARLEAARRSPASTVAPGAVAVIPIHGVIIPRADVLSELFGATSAERIGEAFSAALASPNVSAILLDIDSPGGNVAGIPELAALIASGRGQKPIVAVANHMAASAAYWLAVQADELVVSPSADVGSVGVLTAHDDISGRAEQMGVRRTYITSAKFKAEAHPFGPLSDEARQHLQSRVDEAHQLFVRDVARGRGTSQETVRESFGQGRIVGAARAVKLGMADRIGTFSEVVDRLAGRAARAAGVRAEELEPPLAAAEPIAPEAPETPASTITSERERLRLQLALGSGA